MDSTTHGRRLLPLHRTAIIIETMKLLEFISNAFINTMGITKPSPRAAMRAAWIISAMLLAVLAAVTLMAAFALHIITRH